MGGAVRWDGAARQICWCPGGSCPSPTDAPRNLPIGEGHDPPGHPPEPWHFRLNCTGSPLSLRDPAGVVAIRSPASRKAAAPRQGRNTGPGDDRPRGRCNAAALQGNGLPRRCAPRNDRFGGRMPLDGAAKQICSCPAGTSPRPTGAWSGPGGLVRVHG